jgi:hypothetical protein
MLIVCKSNTTKTLDSVLQTLDETTFLRILETQTKCSSNNGGIAGPVSQEEQHNNVLYTQHNLGHCSIFIRFCTDVQNGAPPTPPHLSTKLTTPDLPNNRLGRSTHQSPRTWRSRRLRSLRASATRHLCETHPHNLQWIRLRCPTMEVRAATTRSSSATRRNSVSILHSYK